MSIERFSPNFSLREFQASEMAARNGIDNTMPEALYPNAIALCENVLEPARAALGPLRINSGYRCKALNSRIRGATHSQHVQGEAADIVPLAAGVSIGDLFRWLYRSGLPIDQGIFEFGGWVHVAHVGGQQRGSWLKAEKIDKKTVYFTLSENDIAEL